MVRLAAASPRRCHLVPDVVGNIESVLHRGGTPWAAMIRGGGCRSSQRSASAACSIRSRSFQRAAAAASEGLEEAEWRRGPFRLLQIAAGMAHRLEEADADAQRGRHHFVLPGVRLLALLAFPWSSPSPFTSFLARSAVELHGSALADPERGRRQLRIAERLLVRHGSGLAFAGRQDLDELARLSGSRTSRQPCRRYPVGLRVNAVRARPRM